MNTEPKLARMLKGWLEGCTNDDESKQLFRDLEEDPSLREAFAAQVAMLGALRTIKDPEPRWLALFDLMETVASDSPDRCGLEERTMARISKMTEVPWHQRFPIIQAAAAILLLGLGWMLLQNPEASNPEMMISKQDPIAPQPVAIILDMQAEDSSLATGDFLQPGQMVLSEGWLAIQTLNGVSITLKAPFDVNLISNEQIQVQHGNIRVHVPPGAEGFKMLSPSFEIIDLGTEFAVVVEADGAGRCRVFEGMADVSLVDSFGRVKQTRRLEASQSVMIDPPSRKVSMIEEEDSAYSAMKIPARTVLALNETYPADVMRMEPSQYWRFESSKDGFIPNESGFSRPLTAIGSARITSEAGGNHSGELTQAKGPGFFALFGTPNELLDGDFSISFYAQFDWLQNYAMVSVSRYDKEQKGHAFILQAFSSFRRSGLEGTGLHAAFRDPPGWIGGTEIYGNSLLRPNFWHHICIVREAGKATLFLDGKPVGDEWVGDMKLDFKNLYVGRLNGNLSQSPEHSRGMVGRIDELAVFPRALSEAEIARLAGGKQALK